MLSSEMRKKELGMNLDEAVLLNSLQTDTAIAPGDLRKEAEKTRKWLDSSPSGKKTVPSQDLMHSGTTVLAMRYQNDNGPGVLMAADRQSTRGHIVSSSRTVKVHPIDPVSLFGAAGLVTYIQDLRKTLQRSLKLFEGIVDTNIFVDGQAELLANVLRYNTLNLGIAGHIMGWVAVPILAGVDPTEKEALIFSFDGWGGKSQRHKAMEYTTVGSGSLSARSILDDRWKNDLNVHQAVMLAVRGLCRSASLDIYTGDPRHYPLTMLCLEFGEDGRPRRRYVDSELAIKLARKRSIDDIENREDGPLYNALLAGGE